MKTKTTLKSLLLIGFVSTAMIFTSCKGGKETTEDKKFTLEVVECLGHCGEGPVMMVNDKIYSYVTKNRAIQILKDCM